MNAKKAEIRVNTEKKVAPPEERAAERAAADPGEVEVAAVTEAAARQDQANLAA